MKQKEHGIEFVLKMVNMSMMIVCVCVQCNLHWAMLYGAKNEYCTSK